MWLLSAAFGLVTFAAIFSCCLPQHFVSHGSAKPIQTPSSSVTGMTVLIQLITQLKDLGRTNDDLRPSDSKIYGEKFDSLYRDSAVVLFHAVEQTLTNCR